MQGRRKMTKIQQESEQAKRYMLKTIKKTNLVALTQDNVARVEAMIQNDAAYLNAVSKNSKPKNEEGGSTAYWMCALEKYINNKDRTTWDYKQIIEHAVCAVDKDNSTHLNADNVGRKQITDRIAKIDPNELTEYLKDPHKPGLKWNDYWLFNKIAAQTKPTDKKYKPRTNKSFASKFCHYACFYLFEGKPEQDNYSIYDSVVKEALPLYAKYYDINIKEYNLEDYVDYSKIIEKILEMSGNNISKNGFDHLLWYYFKGRNIKNIKTE